MILMFIVSEFTNVTYNLQYYLSDIVNDIQYKYDL